MRYLFQNVWTALIRRRFSVVTACRCAEADSGPSNGRHNGDHRSRPRSPHQRLRGCNGARDDVECYEFDINLLTGQWTEKTWIGDGRNRKVRKGVKKTVQPYRLKDAALPMDR